MRTIRLIITILSLTAPLVAAPLPATKALPVEALRTLMASQDAVNDMDFDKAERLAQTIVTRYPLHPLPRIFLQGALLARIQENIAAKVEDEPLFTRFNLESDGAVDLAEQWQAANPGPEAMLYVGNSMGARGLVKLYQGSVLAAYHDGQKASASLREAVKDDPQLYEAYLGLGQYEYYCGRMSGVLRWVANLQGDTASGIALLKTGAAKGVCVAIPARSALARILSEEEPDFGAALPYVIELRQRYPSNYSYAQYALAVGRGLGWKDPRARLLGETLSAQWDKGWRPPSYAKLDLVNCRLEMAKALPSLRLLKEVPED